METWLNVAEKPSVAKEMASVLSGGTKRSVRTFSKYNPVFEFKIRLTNGRNVNMIATSVAGHMMDLEFGPRYKYWEGVSYPELFNAPVTKQVKSANSDIKNNLEQHAKKATCLVLWLDCDREGENIAFEVGNVVTNVKSKINILRARFSALTSRDLFYAVNNLAAPNKALSDAVDARQEMDLRIGAAFTRFQTISFRDKFENMPKVVSLGPCQFPTLGFVVKQYWSRESFVSEKFYSFLLRHNNGTSFSCLRGNIYDMLTATFIFEEMMERALPDQKALITSVTKRPHRRKAPCALSTVALQKAAATHLKISSEQTMQMAEDLYQKGFISYPRTETDSFSYTDEELKAMARLFINASPYSDYVEWLLNDDSPQQLGGNDNTRTSPHYKRPVPGGHDDKAHPPIHPTKLYVSNDPNDPKGRLYDYIVRHFLACMSADAVGAQTTVIADFGGEAFTTSGQTVIERNFLDIFTYQSWSSTTIPNFNHGDTFDPLSVMIHEGTTVAPSLLTETALISLMDDQGIGTDATIAQHIKTIQERGYVTVKRGVFTPSPLGVALVAAYEEIGIPEMSKPHLRAQMELAMADIASGKATKEAVIVASAAQYKAILEKVMVMERHMVECLRRYLTPSAVNHQQPGQGSINNPRLLQPALNIPACLIIRSHCSPGCQGQRFLNQNSDQRGNPRFSISCTACSIQMSLPFASMVKVADMMPNCEICSGKKVSLQLGMMLPGCSPEETTCLFCDGRFSPYIV